MGPPVPSLDAARQLAALTVSEPWLRYLGPGGCALPAEFAGYLSGASPPDDHEHDVLALALNERFFELGLDHPVPYAADHEPG